MIYREAGKIWTLPDHIRVSDGGYRPYAYAYKVLGFRPPRKGEWYLSGAEISAYQAQGDLIDNYLVIERGGQLVPKTVWVPKEEA
jgi:hypothetical protein